MARRRKRSSNRGALFSNDIVKYSAIGVAVLAALMLIINFAPTGQFYNMQTYNAYGYNAFEELPETFALSTFAPGMDMLSSPIPSDHDKDGVSDQKECPKLFLDTDGDTLPDIVETLQTGTDPNNADTDGDGFPDDTDSHPLDETLPIPPTIEPSDPLNPEPGPGNGGGLGDGGESLPGSDENLDPTKQSGFGGISGTGEAVGMTGSMTADQFRGTEEGVTEGGIHFELKNPTASFTYDPISPTVGETITFDASKSNTGLMAEVCTPIIPNFYDYYEGEERVYNTQKECESMLECTSEGEDREGLPINIYEITTKEECDEKSGQYTGSSVYAWGKPSIAEYNWNFGNDAMGMGMSTTHTYSSEGVFDVDLTVIASNGIKGTSTQTLAVGPKAPTPPPAGIGAIVSDPAAEGKQVLDWITDKTLAGNFRNCPDNPRDVTKGNGIPDIIDRGSDYDGDGWTDFYESRNGGVNGEGFDNPPKSDTDGDGFNDAEEGAEGSDPSDPTSIPSGQGEGETSLILSYDSTTNVCELLILPGSKQNALAILKISDAGTVTGFIYQTRELEFRKSQTLTMSKPSAGDLCEGFLWEDWSGTPLTTKVEIAI